MTCSPKIRLAAVRVNAGLSQSELANKMCVSRIQLLIGKTINQR